MDNIEVTKAIGYLVVAIGAIGALGTAAFGLVDATKSYCGGVSNVGFGDLMAVLKRFAAALDQALGVNEWRTVVQAHVGQRTSRRRSSSR